MPSPTARPAKKQKTRNEYNQWFTNSPSEWTRPCSNPVPLHLITAAATAGRRLQQPTPAVGVLLPREPIADSMFDIGWILRRDSGTSLKHFLKILIRCDSPSCEGARQHFPQSDPPGPPESWWPRSSMQTLSTTSKNYTTGDKTQNNDCIRIKLWWEKKQTFYVNSSILAARGGNGSAANVIGTTCLHNSHQKKSWGMDPFRIIRIISCW